MRRQSLRRAEHILRVRPKRREGIQPDNRRQSGCHRLQSRNRDHSHDRLQRRLRARLHGRHSARRVGLFHIHALDFDELRRVRRIGRPQLYSQSACLRPKHIRRREHKLPIRREHLLRVLPQSSQDPSGQAMTIYSPVTQQDYTVTCTPDEQGNVDCYSNTGSYTTFSQQSVSAYTPIGGCRVRGIRRSRQL